MFQIFAKFNLINDAAIDGILLLALIKNLFHVDTRCIVADLNVDLLLKEHIVCNLIIH